MNWWPRSLTSSLLALLLLGVVSTVLISSQWDTKARIHPLSRSEHHSRTLAVWQLLAAAPASAETLLTALSLPEAQFSLHPDSALAADAMDAQESALAQHLRQRLALPPNTDIRVSLRKTPTDAAANAWTLQEHIPLADGRWLHSQYQTALIHPHWDRVLRFSLPIVAFSVILVSFLFSHRIVRPLKALAEAVTRISRGEPPRPLPLEGPRSVRDITAAFNDMHERLDRFITSRTRMIAAISHDLRTPLASLRIRAELIPDAALREEIIRTVDEMGVMAEETLYFARDDATREPAQTVNLVDMIDESIQLQRNLGHAIEWIAPASIPDYHCRPVHLKRALGILLDNAIRYGGGRVEVKLASTESAIQIEIHDNGSGIAEAELERVFEPFVRLDAARSLETGGVGLGLAIARSCVYGQGGELHLRNREEGGLMAVMELPL